MRLTSIAEQSDSRSRPSTASHHPRTGALRAASIPERAGVVGRRPGLYGGCAFLEVTRPRGRRAPVHAHAARRVPGDGEPRRPGRLRRDVRSSHRARRRRAPPGESRTGGFPSTAPAWARPCSPARPTASSRSCCLPTRSRLTSNTLVSRIALREDIMLSRARGFAVDDEEHEIGSAMRGGAGVQRGRRADGGDLDIGSVGLGFSRSNIPRLGEQLRRAAAGITPSSAARIRRPTVGSSDEPDVEGYRGAAGWPRGRAIDRRAPIRA